MKSKSLLISVLGVFFVLLTLLSVNVEAAQLNQTSGKVTLLRINSPSGIGSGYGSKQDFIDGEVIIKLDSHPGSAYGFQLRNNGERPVHEAMFALLQDAYKNNWKITIDYLINPGKKNGAIQRIWVAK